MDVYGLKKDVNHKMWELVFQPVVQVTDDFVNVTQLFPFHMKIERI